MTSPIDADARTSVEDQIRAIQGVVHASVDPRSGDVWVVRDRNHEPEPIELAVRNRLIAMGHELADARVRVTLPGTGGPRRRVRFVSTERSEGSSGVTVTVKLEWNNVVHSGSATGEKGAAVELKTTAQAALAAVETLCGCSIGLRIVGVKQVHAFDSDIMVASLLQTDGAPHRMVGAVIVADNPMDSAAVAVLSGLNRRLGNFLHTSD